MLARRRLLGKFVMWTMGLTVLGVGYVTFVDSHPGQDKKVEANRIMSPWDLSRAPSPYMDRSAVKVKPVEKNPPKKASTQPKQDSKRSARLRMGEGSRIVDARTAAGQTRHIR